MDLVKLVAELREYRAQIEEAIVAIEQLARRRHPGARVDQIAAVQTAAAPVQKKGRKASPEARARAVKKKER